MSNATVSGIHAAGTGCTAGETLTSATLTAAGKLRLALPYGTWRIRATVTSGSPSITRTGTSANIVVTPTTVQALTVVVLP